MVEVVGFVFIIFIIIVFVKDVMFVMKFYIDVVKGDCFKDIKLFVVEVVSL